MNAQTQRGRFYVAVQVVLLAFFVFALMYDRGAPLFLSGAAHAAGSALCAAGAVLTALAFVALRDVIQIAPEPRAGGHLVTGGIYRYLRHPIYTGVLAIVVGLLLRKPTLLVTLAGAVLVVFFIVKTRYEERRLAARYPEYEEYRKQTWGVIPGLRS